MTTRKKEAGFSPVEVLLAAAVFGMIVTAVIGAIIYGRSASADAGDNIRAVSLADEGIQAVTNIGNAAFANLTDGTFGLAQSGGMWVLSGSSDTSGIFTRACTIATGLTADHKTVTCTVTWSNPQSNSTSATTELTNWQANIKSWANGAVVGTADPVTTANAIKVDTVGDYAYVILSATSSNFLVIDISDPTSPTIVATVSVAASPTNVTVSGNYAYVTNSSNTAELQIVDISNPAAPTIKSSLNMAGTGDAVTVTLSGLTAFVGRNQDTTASAYEVTTVNVANPAAPTVLGGYNVATLNITGLYVKDNYAYAATNSTTQEMLVLNATNLAALSLTYTYNAPTSVAAATINGFGNMVYLVVSNTVRAIDITQPSAPVAQAATFTAAGAVNKLDIGITGVYAFLGTSSTSGEFQVIDIANPAAISSIKIVNVSGTSSTINGMSYNSKYDIVVGASASNTQEVIVFSRT